MKTKGTRESKISLITLGCSKNLVDSENIITQLQANDYAVTHDQVGDADIVIVNTCGFIDLAKEESVNTILECAELKKDGEIEKLYVTGCLSQRYKDDLEQEIPEVDAYFGTVELPSLLHTLQADYRHDLIGERSITTPAHYAYMKISEGCNRTCSFCAIPLMRGKHVSKPIERLVHEAKHFAKQGVRELILIAQELTYYGLDIYKERALADLLEELAGVEGIEWIRLHYAYPSKFPLDVIETMARHDNICNYLDMPLQHASDRVLMAMRRQITQSETRELIQSVRKIIPGIAIRTTFLVGYPGETEEDFEELCQFVRDMRFERVGVFQYSHEEDTFAHQSPDDVPAEIKEERAAKIMEIQREISLEKNQQLLGRTVRILVDRKEGEYFIGRTEFDSPEVDNEVLIPAENHFLRVGDFEQVRITDVHEYDLFAEPIR